MSDAIAQACPIPRRHQKAIHPILHQFAHPSDLSGNDRHPRRHRLHQRHRHAFGKAGQHKHIGGLQGLAHLPLGLIAEEVDLAIEAEAVGQGFEGGAIGPIADDDELEIWVLGLDLAEALEQDGQSLFGGEATDVEQAFAMGAVLH